MMQRVLHISSEYADELYMFTDRFTIKNMSEIGNIISVIVSYDSFSDFNTVIYNFILKTCAKKKVFYLLRQDLKYLNYQEQNLIFKEICQDINGDKHINQISVLTASRSIINPDGIFNFALTALHDDIIELCATKCNEYALRNEYLDFIRMLRFFASVNYGSVNRLHVVMKSDFSADVLDEEYKEFNNLTNATFEIACLNELAEYDSLISMLVEVSPKEIILHNWKKYKNSEIPETLINIFDDRVKFCDDCHLCKQ